MSFLDDTVFADTPAVDSGGMKCAQVFVGCKTLVVEVFQRYRCAAR